jgi:nitric oxide dioxygenase
VPISNHHKLLVVESFLSIASDTDRLAAQFYARLFELAPEVRPMFKGDMAEQGRKLMQMIHIAVNGLNKFDMLVPQLQTLGERHVSYGVTREQYMLVGEALLWALERTLRDRFTEETRDAWSMVYEAIVDATTSGLYNN